MRCSNCGTENAASTKFCAECGTPTGVAQQPSVAERRQLTVFFVDLVGASAMSEALDPEELRDLYAKYQKLCSDVIARYEGHVAQYLGDGILAYFGYPVAHEDDAVRAVQSALEVIDGVARIELHGTRPRVRIGIHTGLVVVGDVGSGHRKEQLALGEAPNVAARVQSEAAPNSVLITEATRRLIAGHFAFEDAGSPALKGISRPMQLFRVVGKSGTSRFAALNASALARFVGREAEMDAIRSAWARSANGAGQTLLLRGEAGIGKSRILGAAKQEADDREHELYEIECSPFETNTPLHPIITMLERRLALTHERSPADRLAAVERFVADHAATLGDDAVPVIASLLSIPTGEQYASFELPPARRRVRTLELLADLFLRAAGATPVLMLIEDLHWSDPTTLELVASLVARQTTARLCMIATARPQLDVTWPPASNWRKLRVDALPQSDARALIAAVAGRKPIPEEVLQQIVERTGGIPLFVEAVTRSIIETGALRETEDRFVLAEPLPPGLIPTTVHDSLMARIDRLGADKSIAQMASTIGRDFTFELLRRVSGQDAADLERVMGRLLDLDLVSQDGIPPNATYTFKHALIQDAAYESLLRKTRQEYHGKIAETLLAQFPETVEHRPELVAHHFTGGGNAAMAVKFWLVAGQAALGRAANHEAIAHLKRGLALVSQLPEPERLTQELELQAAIAPALTATQGWASPELDRAYRRAQELLDLIGDTPHRLPVLWGKWAYHFVAGHVGQSLTIAPQVLDLASKVGSPPLLVAARHATSCSYCYHGDFAQSLEHSNAGLALFDIEHDRFLARNFGHANSVCLESFKGDAMWMLGFPDQALEASDRSLALARELNHMPSLAWAVSYKTWFHHLLRDAPRILEMANEATRLSGEEGFAFWDPMVTVYRGWAMAAQGDHAGGIAHMRDGLARYRAAGNGCTQCHMIGALAEALWAASQWDEAFSVLREGMTLAKTNQEGFYEPEFYRLQGEFLLEQALGNAGSAHTLSDSATLLTAAERSIRDGLELARRQGAKSLELRGLMSLARVRREIGDAADARTALRALYNSFSEGLGTPDLRDARALLAELG